MATFYFSYMHAHKHIHTFSLLGGLRVNVEGDPRVTSPGQVLPGNSAINRVMEPHWRPTKAHKPPRPSPLGNLKSVGKRWGLHHVKMKLKIKGGCSKSTSQEYDKKRCRSEKFPMNGKDSRCGI